MEGAQATVKTEGSENPEEADLTANKSSGKSALRFGIDSVNLDPNQEVGDKDDDHSPRMDFTNSNPPLSVHDATTTIGYATHDAVPMTVFYRNENSQSNSTKKSRPTLKELRRGFEEDHEQQV